MSNGRHATGHLHVLRPIARNSVLAMLLLLVLGSFVAAATAGQGLNVSGTWKSVYHCKTGWCAGQDFPAGPFKLVQAKGSSSVTNGSDSGTLTGHTLVLHGDSGGYSYHATVTLAPDGNSWSGTLSDSRGTTGTDTGTRIGRVAQTSIAVAITAPQGLNAVAIGDVFTVSVKVRATGGDLKDVRLSKGLFVTGAKYGSHNQYTSCGSSLVVTDSPPEASGFPLASDETRTFSFKVRAHKAGPATLNAHAVSATDSGDAIEASDSAVVHVESNLTRGGKPVAIGPPVTCTFAGNH